MAEEKTFLIKIITPERVFYEGTAIMAEFNTSEGEIGVYAGHIPLTVILKPGVLTLTEESGKKKAALHTGFAEILPDQISILAEAAEWPGEIDIKRAEAALKHWLPVSELNSEEFSLHRICFQRISQAYIFMTERAENLC